MYYKELKPDIIYAALSGFGQTGPYKDRKSYAMIAEAMSSHTRLTGDGVDPEGPPIEMAMAYGDIGPGTMAAFGIVSALRHRDSTGEGQMLDLAQIGHHDSFQPRRDPLAAWTGKPCEMRKTQPRRRHRWHVQDKVTASILGSEYTAPRQLTLCRNCLMTMSSTPRNSQQWVSEHTTEMKQLTFV